MHPLSLCGPITVHTAMGERERESDGTDRVKGGKEERVRSAWRGGYHRSRGGGSVECYGGKSRLEDDWYGMVGAWVK